jgi:endoglucanase
MKLSLKNLILIVFSVSYCISYSQDFLQVKNTFIVNESGNPVVLKGLNLEGWMIQRGKTLGLPDSVEYDQLQQRIEALIGAEKMEKFNAAWRCNFVREIDISSMAVWGFNAVRLPIHYALFTLSSKDEPIPGEHTWLDTGFAMTDSLLQWCKKYKVYLIISLQVAPGFQVDEANNLSHNQLIQARNLNRSKTIALCQKLAERYADEPWIAAYDILPTSGHKKVGSTGLSSDNTETIDLLMNVTNAIRAVDQKHIVFVEENWVNAILPSWDRNIVISVEKYNHNNDRTSLQAMLDMRNRYNVPIWLREAGENSNTWACNAISLLNRHNIGWCWSSLKKIGLGSVQEVIVNTEYQCIRNFWQGKGIQPSPDVAYKGLMKLTNNLKLENCYVRKDMIDAMMRQINSREARPFNAEAFGNEFSIEAVHYDLGKSEIAYFDYDIGNYSASTRSEEVVWNRGGVYRNDGVDIERCSNGNKSHLEYYVSHIETGEWLQYTIYVEEEGLYAMKITVSSDKGRGKINITVNNDQIKSSLAVPDTGGAERWKTLDVKNITLQRGTNVLCIKAKEGGFNFKSMSFAQTNRRLIIVSR